MTNNPQEPIRVVITFNLDDHYLEQIRAVSDRLIVEKHQNASDSAYAEAEVLFTGSRFPEPQQAPRLRWIQLLSAGMDGALKQPIVQAEDIEITSTSGIHAVQMAEFGMAMMLAFMYRLPELLELQAKAEWPEHPQRVFSPHGLRDLTLGIVGYGSIGRELARIAQAMGMKILATKRNLKSTTESNEYTEAGLGDPAGEIPDRYYPPEALVSMASACDFLVLLTPLTDDTYHMVNEDVFKAMKKISSTGQYGTRPGGRRTSDD